MVNPGEEEPVQEAHNNEIQDECLLSIPGTCLHVNWNPISVGTLSMYKSVLSWLDTEKNVGFSIRYPNISIHAIRNDPFPALYAMLDIKLRLPEEIAIPEVVNPDDDLEGDCESCGESLTEVMFQPPDPSIIQRMYSAMNECQALHPDPYDSPDSEAMDDDDFNPNEQDEDDEEENHMEVAEENLQRLQLEGSNGHPPQNGGSHDPDPDQFADD